MKKVFFITLSLIFCFAVFADNKSQKIELKSISFQLPENVLVADEHNIYTMIDKCKEEKKFLLFVKEYSKESFYKTKSRYLRPYDEELAKLNDENARIEFTANIVKNGKYPINREHIQILYSNYKNVIYNDETIGNYVMIVYIESGWVFNLGSYYATFIANDTIYEYELRFAYPVSELKDKNISKFITYNENSYSPTKHEWISENNKNYFKNTLINYFHAVENKSPDISQDLIDFQTSWEEILNSLTIK